VFFDDESANGVATSEVPHDGAIHLTLRALAAVACCLLRLAWIWSLFTKHSWFIEPESLLQILKIVCIRLEHDE
jgi:hypothetical protein